MQWSVFVWNYQFPQIWNVERGKRWDSPKDCVFNVVSWVMSYEHANMPSLIPRR